MVVILTTLVTQSVAKRCSRACRISRAEALLTCSIRKELGDDCIRDNINDIEYNGKIGVSKVCVVCIGLVVFGLDVVDLGYAPCFRRLV